MNEDLCREFCGGLPPLALLGIFGGGEFVILAWAALLACGAALVGLTVLLVLSLRRRRLAPALLVQSLHQIIETGNYQEAWEVCHSHRGVLANTLKAALERIGRGKEIFDATLAEHLSRGEASLRAWIGYLLMLAAAAPMFGLLGAALCLARTSYGTEYDPSGSTPLTTAMSALACGLAIGAPAAVLHRVFSHLTLRSVAHVRDQLEVLTADLPFEELQGLRVGEHFSAGSALDKPAPREESRRVSLALTTNCPVCNASVKPGENPCSRCGAVLDWKA